VNLSTKTPSTIRLPSVSILLVNYNGHDHLQPCLDSIAALDYPANLVETILVDNDSQDGSRELLRANYPWVTLIEQSMNIGFAPAVNLGAAHSAREAIAILNNDMRVDPQWLKELSALWNPAAGVVCVAGTIVNWEGTHLDFGDGVVNFHGFGDQPGFNRELNVETEKVLTRRNGTSLPFACGGSLLVDRQVFVDLGGFDPKFFAYFEDVDFGLRLQVCGFTTVLASKARSFHRHHGTSSKLRMHERMVLLERNALRILAKNVSDENLPKLLAGALLLAAERANFDARSDRSQFDVGAGEDELHTVHRLGTARMHAVNDFVADLPEITALRADIGRRRQRSDAEVFSHFGAPLQPMGNDAPSYVAAFNQVTSFLGIRSLFGDAPIRKITLLSNDLIGPRMAGTAIRTWELACALSSHAIVTIASDRPVDRQHPGVDSVVVTDQDMLRAHIDQADAVVVFGFDIVRYPFLADSQALRIVDLYDPWIFGSLEQYDSMSNTDAERSKAHEVNTLNQLADVGDFFVCASERQRDFWLGLLASRGRLDKASHEADPHLRALIDVVPYGVPSVAPSATPSLLRDGRFPSINKDSQVILWGGGTWDWFDPLGTLEAFESISHEFPNARLFFMGLELEGRGIPTMASTQRLIDRARDRGMIADGRVVLGPWVPYDDRGTYLREADIGVVAAKAMAESRLAFRTRMLDHFWAGLPTLTTEGDVLSELVATSGAGIVVPANNIEALANGMRTLLSSTELAEACRARSFALADQFRWSSVIGPVARLITNPGPWRASRARRHQPG
jgi:GT2 family glycosyltransferase/glycosyltransferase involved in cell wall biosynthesis